MFLAEHILLHVKRWMQGNPQTYTEPDTRAQAAHVMAMAVQRLYPDARTTIGPCIENGFYYDFDIPQTLSDSDLKKIKSEMVKIIKADMPFIREEVGIRHSLLADVLSQLESHMSLRDGRMSLSSHRRKQGRPWQRNHTRSRSWRTF